MALKGCAGGAAASCPLVRNGTHASGTGRLEVHKSYGAFFDVFWKIILLFLTVNEGDLLPIHIILRHFMPKLWDRKPACARFAECSVYACARVRQCVRACVHTFT